MAASDDASLGTLLSSALARRSDGTLAAMAAVGLIGSSAIALALPSWWRVAPLFVLLGAAGLWGIGDRERASGGANRRRFALARGVAIAAGLVAAATLVLAFFGAALGRWIS